MPADPLPVFAARVQTGDLELAPASPRRVCADLRIARKKEEEKKEEKLDMVQPDRG